MITRLFWVTLGAVFAECNYIFALQGRKERSRPQFLSRRSFLSFKFLASFSRSFPALRVLTVMVSGGIYERRFTGIAMAFVEIAGTSSFVRFLSNVAPEARVTIPLIGTNVN